MSQNINTDSTGEKFQQLFNWLLPAVYVFGGSLVVAFALNFSGHRVSQDSGDWGALGDYFGGLMNPVISFATLLVAYAVWKLQRVELEETKKALRDQAETAERQRTEQRFFDLLDVYYRTIESLRFDQVSGGYGSPIYRQSFHGKDALGQWFSTQGAIFEFLKNKGQYNKADSAPESEASNANYISSLGREWEESDKANRFGAMLRTLESVFSTATIVLSRDQGSFLALLKAQLSSSELSLIAYQLLFEEHPSMLRALVERFGLLENLERSDLRAALEDKLPSAAFASLPSEPMPQRRENQC